MDMMKAMCKKYQTQVERYSEEQNIKNMSMAIVDSVNNIKCIFSDPIWERDNNIGLGWKRPDFPYSHQDEIHFVDPFYEIGSVTKTFTTLLLALAYERGLVHLKDPVNMYISHPIFNNRNNNWRPMTLLDLATHRSGLPTVSPKFEQESVEYPTSSYSLNVFLQNLHSIQLEDAPGSKFIYSNLGITALSIVLERVFGKSYNKLLADEILNPLGMSQTSLGFSYDDISLRRRFLPAVNIDNEIVPYYDMGVMNSAGGIKSTIHDMAKYAWLHGRAQALHGGVTVTPLDPSVKKPQTLEQLLRAAYISHMMFYEDSTLGWKLDGSNRFISHLGETGGMTSFLGVSMKNGKSIVILSNKKQETLRGFGEKIILEIS